MEKMQLNNVIADEIVARITADVKKDLTEFLEKFKSPPPPPIPTGYLTRTQVASLLSVNLSTVHNWTRSGQLHAVGIGARVYYERSRIEESLIHLNK
jgi:hypothetical protein